MIPHLQHRALCHIAQHNTHAPWASEGDRAHLAQYITNLDGGRYQLNSDGWAQIVRVRV